MWHNVLSWVRRLERIFDPWDKSPVTTFEVCQTTMRVQSYKLFIFIFYSNVDTNRIIIRCGLVPVRTHARSIRKWNSSMLWPIFGRIRPIPPGQYTHMGHKSLGTKSSLYNIPLFRPGGIGIYPREIQSYVFLIERLCQGGGHWGDTYS